jgi:tRNA (mo5U34)-methyltransferase
MDAVTQEDFSYQSLRQEHLRMTATFNRRAQELGCENVSDYFWYHTIDLGDGLITPGTYDYRFNLDQFHFPENMLGLRVLDVGSGTGFFAFEFERRGAEVTSVDLPSMANLDRFPGETLEQTIRKVEEMMREHALYSADQKKGIFGVEALKELHRTHLDGPFKFCHSRLKSKVARCYSTIYEVSREKLGQGDFDLVFIGDVLVHTINPLQALAAVAALCRGTLVVSQVLAETAESRPMMLYVGGDRPGEDEVTWWWPNHQCFEQMLRKLGFREATMVGNHTGRVRPGGGAYKRAVIHARR